MTITITLTASQQMLLYGMIRDKFDENPNNTDNDQDLIDIAHQLQFTALAQEMLMDSSVGKETLPQPPQGCPTVKVLTREEWHKKILMEGGKPL